MAALIQGQSGCLTRKILQLSVTPVQWKHRLTANRRRWLKEQTDTSWARPLLDWPKEKEILQAQEPSPLHLVMRVECLRGRPKKEKRMAESLGLGENVKNFQKVILKNTTETNTKLKLLKHILRIVPVTFPYGVPEDESDWEHCYLRDNGEFIVRKRLKEENEQMSGIEITPDRGSSLWVMDRETMDKECAQKLLNFDVNKEYFKPIHPYKRNEDGKEFRYFGDKRFNGRGRTWF